MEISLFILVAALVFIIKALKVVPQQNSWVVERLGRFHAALLPGLNIVIPFVAQGSPARCAQPGLYYPG